jgi:hypothetical protein
LFRGSVVKKDAICLTVVCREICTLRYKQPGAFLPLHVVLRLCPKAMDCKTDETYAIFVAHSEVNVSAAVRVRQKIRKHCEIAEDTRSGKTVSDQF